MNIYVIYFSVFFSIFTVEIARADLWIWNDWAQPSTPHSNLKDSVSVRATSYRGNVLTGIDASLDVHWFNLGLSARKTIFAFDQTGDQIPSENSGRINQFGVETAREFTSSNGYLGRLGISLNAFYPDTDTFIKLQMATGKMEPNLAWQFVTTIFKGISKTNDLLNIALDLWMPGGVEWGIRADYLMRLVSISRPPNTLEESNLLGLGPWVQFHGGGVFFRVGMAWHLRVEHIVGNSERLFQLEALPDFQFWLGGTI